MRSPNVLLPLALLLILNPTSHAAIHSQVQSHQHIETARQSTVAFHPNTNRYRTIAFTMRDASPETINPPTRTTVFSYVVNLIRGLFSRAW